MHIIKTVLGIFCDFHFFITNRLKLHIRRKNVYARKKGKRLSEKWLSGGFGFQVLRTTVWHHDFGASVLRSGF